MAVLYSFIFTTLYGLGTNYYYDAKIVQTDIMDLLGSDLPVESDEGIKFAWSDGILLQVKRQIFSY